VQLRRLPVLLGLTAVLALAASTTLSAQSLWPRPLASKGELDLEFVHPTFPDGASITGARIWVLSGRMRVGERGRVVVALPYLEGRSSGGFSGSSTNGDPYIGYESTDSTGKSTIVLGLRLPWAGTTASAPEEAALLGDYDRFEEAFPKTITLHFEGQGEVWRGTDGADVRIRAGSTLLHATEGGSGADANTFLFDYGIRFGRPAGPVELGLALTGRLYLSGSGGNIAQRSTHQATFELAGHGRIAPRVGIRVPIDEPLKSAYDRAIILGVRAAIQ
jgi:hypothetical protein